MKRSNLVFLTTVILFATVLNITANYKLSYGPKVQAWIAADACLAQANVNIRNNHTLKVRSEVEATQALYCIQRAKGIAHEGQ